MNTAAIRGAILVTIAVIVGAIVLGQGFSSNSAGTLQTGGSSDAATEATPTPQTTADGAVIEEIDTDGDGEPDTPAIDTDGDGTADTEGVDTDGDGVIDAPADTVPPLTPQPKPPAEVRVLVANGTSINGAAGVATDKLIARNYATLTPTNAESVESTTIYYEEGYEADALLIAEYLSAQPSQVAPMPATDPGGVDRRGANIVVILGSDEVTQPAEAEPTG
jgi:hypothetical protein